jgi:hypothetical protein
MAIKMPSRRPTRAEDFIAGATAAPGVVRPDLPWTAANVRDDLRVQLNARVPERLALQCDYLARRIDKRKQDIVEIALRAWVQQQLKELGLPEH